MKFFLSFLIASLFSCAPTQKIFDPPKQMIVNVPVLNLRAKQGPHSGEYKFDPLQETQLELGEPVMVLQKDGPWARIEAPEQLEYSHNNKWEGYPGWVEYASLTKDLSKFHKLNRSELPTELLRKRVLNHAQLHLNHPYLWGGRSLHDPENKSVATGVDCSGLVNWSFRQEGWFVPRDAHEQHMRARPVESKDLKPGDLFFFANEDNPNKIVHVGFFAGDEMLVEAPSSGLNVRKISFKERIGKDRENIKNREKVNNRIVYFGTFFIE